MIKYEGHATSGQFNITRMYPKVSGLSR